MKINYTRTEVLPAMALVIPLAVLVIVRVFLGNGPESSPAATNSSTDILSLQNSAPTTATITLTQNQQDAIAWLSTHPLPTDLDSPMYRPPVADSPDSSQDHVDSTVAPLAHSVRLSSIAGTGKRAVASISGKLYRTGDEITEGWKITKIDVVNRQVTCKHSSGIVEILQPTKNSTGSAGHR